MNQYTPLQGYLDDEGKFDRLPGKRQKQKQALMLQYLAEQFTAGRRYSEREVNEILNRHHSFEDPATLRRMLFGSKLLGRTIDGRAYWLIGEAQS